jgi:hypothetical protein
MRKLIPAALIAAALATTAGCGSSTKSAVKAAKVAPTASICLITDAGIKLCGADASTYCQQHTSAEGMAGQLFRAEVWAGGSANAIMHTPCVIYELEVFKAQGNGAPSLAKETARLVALVHQEEAEYLAKP